MYSVSLVHQKLYLSEEYSNINLQEYLSDLVDACKDGLSAGEISFQLDLSNVLVDASQAVGIGLIVNEAVTNAIKYAFLPGQVNRRISVALTDRPGHVIEVIISDNGTGLPDDFQVATQQSPGMQLIEGLARQLNGTVQFYSWYGLSISLRYVRH